MEIQDYGTQQHEEAAKTRKQKYKQTEKIPRINPYRNLQGKEEHGKK